MAPGRGGQPLWASGLGRGGQSMLRGTGSPRGTAGQGSWCPHRVRAASTRGGAAAVGGGVLYRRVNQTGENTKAEGSGFSLLEKRVTNVEKEKSRMNSVISDWDWKNCCEHTISNTQRHRNGHRYVRVPVCTHTRVCTNLSVSSCRSSPALNVSKNQAGVPSEKWLIAGLQRRKTTLSYCWVCEGGRCKKTRPCQRDTGTHAKVQDANRAAGTNPLNHTGSHEPPG